MLRIAAAAMLLAMTGSAPALAQAYPEIRDLNQGRTEVRTSQYCRIFYDARGNRSVASRECTGRDLQQGARLLREHRQNGYRPTRPTRPVQGPGLDYPYARPVVGDRVEVNISRNCRVIYDARNRQVSATRNCSRRDLGRAQAVLNDYRRSNSGYGNNGPWQDENDFGWLRGRDMDRVEDLLEDRDFDRVDRWRPDYGGRYSMWWNDRTRRCLRIYERDDRVSEIFNADPRDCR